MALGQLRCNRIQPLPFLEPIGAFLLLQSSGVTKPRGAHARSNLCHCSRPVVRSQQSEAGGFDSLFVKAGRHKKAEAAGGAKIEFTLGHFASNYSIVGKHDPPLIAKQASPLAQ